MTQHMGGLVFWNLCLWHIPPGFIFWWLQFDYPWRWSAT